MAARFRLVNYDNLPREIPLVTQCASLCRAVVQTGSAPGSDFVWMPRGLASTVWKMQTWNHGQPPFGRFFSIDHFEKITVNILRYFKTLLDVLFLQLLVDSNDNMEWQADRITQIPRTTQWTQHSLLLNMDNMASNIAQLLRCKVHKVHLSLREPWGLMTNLWWAKNCTATGLVMALEPLAMA